MEERVPVLMTKEDAALWILFQKHYDNIAFLIASKAFNFAKGSFTVDVDSGGTFQRITRQLSTSRQDLPLEMDSV